MHTPWLPAASPTNGLRRPELPTGCRHAVDVSLQAPAETGIGVGLEIAHASGAARHLRCSGCCPDGCDGGNPAPATGCRDRGRRGPGMPARTLPKPVPFTARDFEDRRARAVTAAQEAGLDGVL